MTAFIRALLLLSVLVSCAESALAQQAGPGAADAGAHGPKTITTAPGDAWSPRSFTTSRSGTFGGNALSYVATAADTLLTDGHGPAVATVFTFSYVVQGIKDVATRPVTFVFNGGPGSSSLWLHVGALGPRRIAFEDAVHPPTVGPFKLRDNPLSPLDVTDLVFIDPVGTGFSRLLGAGKAEEFYGVNEDARATAEFIGAWLTKNRRWSSPKFVIGESYGTTRIAVLAKVLAGGPTAGGTLPGITLNGAVLLGTTLGGLGDDPSEQALLPTLAATAWYHGKIDSNGQTLTAVVNDARQFAATEYGAALFAGTRLPEVQRQAVAQRLAALTGLSQAFIIEQNLRISASAFAGELLRDRVLQVGRYDARYTLPRAASGGDPVADDPAMGQYTPGFVAAFHEYLRGDLGVSLAENYQVIAFSDVNFKWNWGAETNHARDLAAAMRRNPAMRLMVGSGYYDLETPFAAAEYMINHVEIPPQRVSFKTYESGHMVYLGEQAAQQFARDLRVFIGAGKP